MATFNTSHHQSGGVVLFSGELILLFCDNVNVTLPQTSQEDTGRLYLTTHRMIFTSKSMKGSLKSFSAPFYSMHDLKLEQPIFGANYIKGQVNDAQTSNSVVFKLKFNSGGAIEYGQALQSAARVTRNNAAQNAFTPPPAYTASAAQYYQAPPNVYQPAYNCGFVLPTDVFNQPPPAGFVYTSEAPPPYPGLAPVPAPGANYPPGGQPGGYQPANYPPANGYPPSQAGGYPPAQSGGYPPGPYPPQEGYPPTQPGYPSAGAAYPPTQIGFAADIMGGGAYQQTAPPAYPGYPPASSGYTPASYPANGYPNASAPSAPGYPDKKSQ
ncbi:WW domain binding protein 2 [Tyrophagus putrescentiae]|nr:WW domain binding protein 2 [Tyrophagus putrescentiae]